MRLSDCLIGHNVRISDITMSDSHRKRMMDLGLIPGTEVKVVRKAPLGDPIVVSVRGYLVSFRMSEAKSIQIEAV